MIVVAAGAVVKHVIPAGQIGMVTSSRRSLAAISRLRRRALLQGLGGLAVAGSLPGAPLRAEAPQWSPQRLLRLAEEAALSRSQVEARIAPLFECADAGFWRLTVDVYHQCILGKLRLPDPPLEHPWLTPGGDYVGQWLWDTMFVLDLLSLLPGHRQTIRGVFQNYWEAQARWDQAMPADARGMIPCVILPQRIDAGRWPGFPAFSQAPLLAWGLERVFRRNGDLALLRDGLGPLERFHDWFWRERDVTDRGLIAVGAYSGAVEEARFETYDFEADLDDLNLTPHPGRHGTAAVYGDICIPANTACLLLAEASLARLAAAAGDSALAERRQHRLAKGIAAMRRHMWSQQRGCFLAVRRDTLQQVPTATIGGFMALPAGIATQAQAARMAEALAGAAWATPLPVPTLDRTDPRYGSTDTWRGDAWPVTNYLVAAGLAAYGHGARAANIADAIIDAALRVGISERYDSQSGRALGVAGLGMSCTLVTMALEGLSARRRLVWRRQGQGPASRSRTRP